MEDKELQNYFANLDLYRDNNIERFEKLRDNYVQESQSYIFVQSYLDDFIENIGKLKSVITKYRMISLRDFQLKKSGNLEERTKFIEPIIFLKKEEYDARKSLKKITQRAKNFKSRFPGFVKITEN